MSEHVADILDDCTTVIAPFEILYPKVQQFAMQNMYSKLGTASSQSAAWTETSKSFFQYKSRQGVKIAPDRCILGLLTDLAEKGKQVVITTNLPPTLIEAAITLLAPAGDNTLLRELTGSGRNVYSSTYCNGSGSPLAHLLETLQATPSQTAIIVNNPSDVQSVQSDCLAAIGYTAGNRNILPADLKRAGAVAVFQGCGDLEH